MSDQKQVYKFKCTNGIMKYFLLNRNGKSQALKKTLFMSLLETGEAKEVQPFWK